MITKLWSLLMLKLSRLIVAVKNAFRKKEPTSSEETEWKPDAIDTWMATRMTIKETCQECDYCEECVFYNYEKGCAFAESDEGIPCYWEVDE